MYWLIHGLMVRFIDWRFKLYVIICNIQVRIFTYLIGRSSSNLEPMKTVACNNRGLYRLCCCWARNLIVSQVSPYFLFKHGSDLQWSFSIFLYLMPHSLTLLLVPNPSSLYLCKFSLVLIILTSLFLDTPISSTNHNTPSSVFLLTWPNHCNLLCLN